MKTMLFAFLCAILLTVAADFALDHIGFSSAERTAGEKVRLGDAGEDRRGVE